VAERFVEHLATSGVQRGLIGPREVPRLWERHVLNCAAIHGLLATESEVADVGSGAGLPGVALAIARTDLRMTLVEPLLRRVTWLQEVVDDLALDRVTVIRGRAEDLHGSLCVDAVTARAVAPLPALAAWCLPLLRPGGRLLAIKGSTAQDELVRSVPALRAAGAARWAVESCDAAGLDRPTVVTVVTTAGPTRPGRSRRR
jgi:16S rRNA (guanine527-N7)-methyltransferase